MSNYFTSYEAKKKLYSKIQPGTVWRFKHHPLITFTVKHIDLFNKLAWGVCPIVDDENNIISFEYLVAHYDFQKRGI
jgi:hypothetical protein